MIVFFPRYYNYFKYIICITMYNFILIILFDINVKFESISLIQVIVTKIPTPKGRAINCTLWSRFSELTFK